MAKRLSSKPPSAYEMPEIHILIDSSLSMSGSCATAAMAWYNHLLGRLSLCNNTPTVSLYTFGSRFTKIHDSVSADLALPWRDFYPQEGSTYTQLGVASVYKNHKASIGRRHIIIVITDGKASGMANQDLPLNALFVDPNWTVMLGVVGNDSRLSNLNSSYLFHRSQRVADILKLSLDVAKVDEFNDTIMQLLEREVAKDVVPA